MTSSDSLAVEDLSWGDIEHRQQIIDLRRAVFPTQVEYGEVLDECGGHYGIRCGGKLVAASRLDFFSQPNDIPYLSRIEHLGIDSLAYPLGVLARLVVHPSYRRSGLGLALDSHRVTAAGERDAATMLAVTTTKFWEAALVKQGFLKLGIALPILSGPHANPEVHPSVLALALNGHRTVSRCTRLTDS